MKKAIQGFLIVYKTYLNMNIKNCSFMHGKDQCRRLRSVKVIYNDDLEVISSYPAYSQVYTC